MKRILLITCLMFAASAYTIDMTNRCVCEDATDSTTCTSMGCKWDTSCIEKTCADFTSEAQCDNFKDCAWTNAGVCATFTQCADYKVATSTMCHQKNSETKHCVPSATAGTDGKFACQDMAVTATTFVTCSTLITQATCMGMESSTAKCAWKAGASPPVCAALTMSTCADASNYSKEICGMMCTWITSTNVCQNQACSDVTTSAECILATGFGMTTGTLCAWDGTKCADAADTTKLTVSTCTQFTMATHMWNTNASTCDECTGNSKIISVIISFMILLSI